MSCNNSVLVGDVLSKDIMSTTYMFPGAAGRISNRYTYNETYSAVEPDKQGWFIKLDKSRLNSYRKPLCFK
jgi:hypothetical protein